MTIYRDQLEAVYALIEKPGTWIQRRLCEDASKKSVSPRDPQACRFCLVGALDRLFPMLNSSCCGPEFQIAFEKSLGIEHAPDFNDTHTHAEVLDLLKAAIERAPVRLERPDPESV